MPLPLVIPLAVGAGLAAAGGIGAATSGALGRGSRVSKYGVDRNSYLLGGSDTYAADRAAGFRSRASLSAGRRFIDQTGTNDALAGAARAREGQDRLAFRLNEAVDGRGPSVAEEQMRAGVGAAARNALNVAATSRGGNYAGSAVAAQDANAVSAAEANNAAAQLRAGEQTQARQELANLYASQRSGDVAVAGASQGAQRLELEQAGLNDADYNAMAQNELEYQRAALQGTIAYGQADLQSGLQAQNINAQLDEAARQRRAAFWGGLFNAGAGVASMGIGGRR